MSFGTITSNKIFEKSGIDCCATFEKLLQKMAKNVLDLFFPFFVCFYVIQTFWIK